jgi:TolB protein
MIRSFAARAVRRIPWQFYALIALAVSLALAPAVAPAGPAENVGENSAALLGAFEAQTDVGQTLPGSTVYIPDRGIYVVTGGGENMWAGTDAFHYVYRRASGDFIATANVQIVGTGGNPHRKAGWVVRQSLDPDSPYVSAVVHASGLTSLQFRETKGGPTRQITSSLVHPLAVRLERQGDTFTLSAAMEGKPFETAGSTTLKLQDPVYLGLGVCAHDATALETAVFSSVELEGGIFYGEGVNHPMESSLEIMSVDGTERRVIYRAEKRFEAPNWSRDGKYLTFNEGGKIYTIPAAGGEPKLLNTGAATGCNNDHGFSPDGKWMAVSCSASGHSQIYIVPSKGGKARQVTHEGTSYWHSWSMDGKTLAFAGLFSPGFDVYTVPVEGGDVVRLTEAPGTDDGPDYSPDGKYIYFNSERTGQMQIWRMKPDGTDPVQITNDEHANWFAHPSADGKWLVMISFDKNVKTHPPNQPVMLRVLEMKDDSPVGEPKVLARFFGGQGTINVNSWSPDSRHFAFVSYKLLNP